MNFIGNLSLDYLTFDIYSFEGGDYEMTKFYCVKCRQSREVENAQATEFKNGKPAWKGTCPVCGRDMYRIRSKKEAA